MTRNTSTFLLVFGLVVTVLSLSRLLFMLVGKIFKFVRETINIAQMSREIKHVKGIRHFAFAKKIKRFGDAIILPPRFEGDLMVEDERAIFDEEKQQSIKKNLLEMGEDIVPALTIIKKSKHLTSYTRKKIEELIEEIE